MAELEAALAKLKGSWMTGQPAAKHAPDDWQAVLRDASPEEAELRLVALAGQAAHIAFRPAPPDKLHERRDLPELALPPLGDEHRPLFRRIMESVKSSRDNQLALIRFLSSRGYASHPVDWMPAASHAELIPEVYAPWFRWIEHQPEAETIEDELSEETWDLFAPAERRTALVEMRARDAAAARELIATKAPAEPAERRLRLISVLEKNLSEDDVAFLETLASDRSGKVKELARSYLARLGHGVQSGEDERELADFLKLDKNGTLRPARLKTGAQKARRAALFGQVPLSALAAALELSEQDLVAAWHFSKDAPANEEFLGMVAATAGDGLLGPVIERWLAAADAGIAEALTLIVQRLAPAERRRVVERIAERPKVTFEELVRIANDQLGCFGPDTMHSSPAFQNLIATFVETAKQEPSSARTRRENLASEQIYYLGLMIDAEAATLAAEELIGTGFLSADPRFAMLRLNAALPSTAHAKP